MLPGAKKLIRRAPSGQKQPLDGTTRPSELEVSTRRVRDATVLELAGELDARTVEELAAPLEQAVDDAEADLVVDLSKTRFIDSAGLHVLLNALRRATRQSQKFVVICPPGPVLKVLELSRLVETLAVVPSYKAYAATRSEQ